METVQFVGLGLIILSTMAIGIGNIARLLVRVAVPLSLVVILSTNAIPQAMGFETVSPAEIGNTLHQATSALSEVTTMLR